MNDLKLEYPITTDELKEVFHLRHKVWCDRLSYEESNENQEESDGYDLHSRHVLLRHNETPVGTCRLIGFNGEKNSFPIQKFFENFPFPIEEMGEISRFTVLKDDEEMKAKGVIPRLLLIRGIIHLTNILKCRYVTALLDPKLFRLLNMSGIKFIPLSEPVDFHGKRHPCWANSYDIIEQCSNKEVWNILTDEGKNIPYK